MKIKMALFIVCCTVVLACESDFDPRGEEAAEQFVVEGYIEVGPGASPCFVLLSKTLDFAGEIGLEELNASIVREATVEVVIGGDAPVELISVCWSELDTTLRSIIEEQLGLGSVDPDVDICVFVDLLGELRPDIGDTCRLHVNTADVDFTSSSVIPPYVPLDTLYVVEPPGEQSGPWRQVMSSIADPLGESNFYRYLTSINDGPFIAGLATVTDDALFDGQEFDFTLQKSEPPGSGFDETFGLYALGDTARIKWLTIDQAQFDFWNTLEFGRANQGPFSTYTRVRGNVDGALGVWGASSTDIYTIIIE